VTVAERAYRWAFAGKAVKGNNMKTNNVEIADVRQFASVALADATVKAAAVNAIEAIAGLTGVIGRAVLTYRDSGMADRAIAEHIKSLFEAAGCKGNTVNKALRAAGVRQRGMRCDIGVTKEWAPSIRMGWGDEPETPEGDDEEGEGDDGEKKEKADPAELLARQALKLCGGDKSKAHAALAKALKSV